MPRNVEVRLDRKIVLPLLDIIRQQVSKLEQATNNGESKAVTHRPLAPPDLTDLHTLIGLFQPDFPNTPVIRLSEAEDLAILRACTVLRFDLRCGPLSSISDARMESDKGLTLDSVSDELRHSLACYLFLSTIQGLVLEHFDLPPPPGARPKIPLWDRLLNGIRPQRAAFTLLAGQDTAQAGTRLFQVVVANDSVNLMNYVSAVFRHVLGLSMNESIKRMREVHELKESVVWTGEKEKAETHVAALQSWHLNAALRPAPADTMR